jgi:glyoxylase-like metal-dependent hydrolase (beta-lactamase superfamily II)
MLHYETIPVTPFQQNCSVVWEDEGMTAAIIDPGGDLDLLQSACKQLGVRLVAIWITHAHIDHAGGTAELADQLQLPIIGPHPGDQFWIDGLKDAAASYGFPPSRAFTPTRWLADGDTVTLGTHTLQVRHCPGHTPGHVVFYSAELKRAFVGDVLFAGSIGRTDFHKAITKIYWTASPNAYGPWGTTRCSSQVMVPRAPLAASGAATLMWVGPEKRRA